jgi:Ca2+:H+ antiporter
MVSALFPLWSIAAPLASGGLLVLAHFIPNGWITALLGIALFGSVLAAVHHAEVVAHWLGEPLGTLTLTVAITVIEVSLIVSMMMAGGASTSALARDTVFAAIMLILNGMVGLCLLVGGLRHGEQTFGLLGVSASLATLAAIAVLTLVLPDYTTSAAGPAYTSSQLAFIAVVSLVLYATFTLVQTVRHRDYFLPENAQNNSTAHAKPARTGEGWEAAGLLLLSLIAVVVTAETLAPQVEALVAAAGAPKSVVGILIALLVLLPEGLAAVQAARADRLQTSLNLAIGSALASIGLTIPAVALLALFTGWPLVLGIDAKSSVLLMLTLMVATLSLGTGRTTVLQGAVHLVICAVYIFTTIVP